METYLPQYISNYWVRTDHTWFSRGLVNGLKGMLKGWKLMIKCKRGRNPNRNHSLVIRVSGHPLLLQPPQERSALCLQVEQLLVLQHPGDGPPLLLHQLLRDGAGGGQLQLLDQPHEAAARLVAAHHKRVQELREGTRGFSTQSFLQFIIITQSSFCISFLRYRSFFTYLIGDQYGQVMYQKKGIIYDHWLIVIISLCLQNAFKKTFLLNSYFNSIALCFWANVVAYVFPTRIYARFLAPRLFSLVVNYW